MLSPLAIAELAWLAAAAAAAAAPDAPAPGPQVAGLEEALTFLGFGADERERLLRGETVSRGIQAVSDNEIAVTVAMITPHPMAEVIEYVRQDDTMKVSRDVLGLRNLGDGTPGESDFSGIAFEGPETSEIGQLLNAKPGARFNLSLAEIERFAALRERFGGRRCARNPACAEAVTTEYRRMLLERMLAYRAGGLAAIAPYARKGGGRSRPGAELLAALSTASLISEHLPEVHDYYTNYPEGPDGFENQFYWVKQTVRDRPNFVLVHRIYHVRPEFALVSERHFYVGHTYNSQQILLGLLPAGDRTVVLYLNSTFTDQVTGAMRGVRLRVARGMMQQEILENFDEIREYVERLEAADPHR